ncbi:hypothetical protein ABPG74_002169 [Tetrahymena malaccensis]
MGGVEIDRNQDPSTYQTNSLMSTVFSLLNSMIGGTMLFLPLYFNQTGIITSIIIMIIMGIVSMKGCDIYVQHLKKNEFDIQETLGRIMGNRWRMFFIVISTIYMILVTLLYYSFSIEMVYSLITFIMTHSGSKNYADKADVSYSQFSIQYTVLATIPIFLGLLFLKKLGFMIKIAELGVYAIYSYVIFIFYTFISNLTSGTLQENISDVKLWSFDVGTLASTASLAYQIHTNACPMVKCNKDQSKNRLAVKITYAMGITIYLIIGLIGGLGVLGRVSQRKDGKAHNINDYFADDAWQPLIVEILYLIHLVSMYPILANICRVRVFEIVFKNNGGVPPQWVFVCVNIFFIMICSGVKLIGVSPNTLVDINGAFSCFFIVYLIPSFMHLACYHGSNKFLRSIRKTFVRQSSSEMQRQENLLDNEQESVNYLDSEQEKSFQNEANGFRAQQAYSCNSHTEDIKSVPKTIRLSIYAAILIVGFAIFIYGMYSVIKNAIDGDSN